MKDPIIKLRRHMGYSQVIGAPVEGLPDKVKAAVKVLLDHLQPSTANAREGIMVAAGAFLFFSMALEADEVPPSTFDESIERAQLLVKLAADIIVEVGVATDGR